MYCDCYGLVFMENGCVAFIDQRKLQGNLKEESQKHRKRIMETYSQHKVL